MKKDKEFSKRILKVVLPQTFQYFVFSLVPVSDALMLVKLEQNAMSAVSLATQISFVLSLFTYTVTMGASMLVSQYWGIEDKDSIEQVWSFSQMLMLPVGILFFCLSFFIPEKIMTIYTSEPELINYGAQYLKIVSFSYLFICIFQITDAIMKNTGLIKQVTFVSSMMVFMNIVLNAIFIYGLLGIPPMGVKGAALATILTSLFNLLASSFMHIKNRIVKFRIKYLLHITKRLKNDFIRYSLPLLGNQITWGFGFTTLTIIIGHLGEDAVAANSIVSILKDLISCFCFALGAGATIIIGNELGANRLDKAKEYGSRLCKLAIISGIIAGLIIVISIPVVLDFVNLSETASYYLKWMMVMCVYYMVGRTINTLLNGGIFIAGGDTKFSFIGDTITMWAFIIPVGALAAFVFKAPVLVVFFILNLDEIIKLPAEYIHYKKYKWLRNLTYQEDISTH